MIDTAHRAIQPVSVIPADDPSRKLSVIDPDDPALRHVAVVGDTYTILLSGAETAGKYSLIDMNVPRNQKVGSSIDLHVSSVRSNGRYTHSFEHRQ
jgi:hypothetical protein